MSLGMTVVVLTAVLSCSSYTIHYVTPPFLSSWGSHRESQSSDLLRPLLLHHMTQQPLHPLLFALVLVLANSSIYRDMHCPHYVYTPCESGWWIIPIQTSENSSDLTCVHFNTWHDVTKSVHSEVKG